MSLESTISAAWEDRASLSPTAAPPELRSAVNDVIDRLDAGDLRVAEKHVTVLPGSYLSRSVDGASPGTGRIRIALVASPAEVADAAERIASFTA